MEVCNCSMFCCTFLYVNSSIAIILMDKRELVALLNLSSWCLVMVEWLFLAVPWGCLRFLIVVFPDHTHLLFCWFWLGQQNMTVQGKMIKVLKFYIFILKLIICMLQSQRRASFAPSACCSQKNASHSRHPLSLYRSTSGNFDA